MDVTEPLDVPDRSAWRAWLLAQHQQATVVWLLLASPPSPDRLCYLDAVEEALCFGWIDGLAKRYTPGMVAQRFTPRRPRSGWTELNKARARRLISLGLMTDAGRAVLPDLAPKTGVAVDIEAALRATPAGWTHWEAMPALYRAVRLGYVEEVRRQPGEFQRRLANLVSKTAQNVRFGNWTDGGRLAPEDREG